MTKSLTETSKYLSYILRHNPKAANITLDKEGWTSIEALLENTGILEAELNEIVQTDDKMRYSISLNLKNIRANQGHSTSDVKFTFKKAIPPTVLFHGAANEAIGKILKAGLLPMNRHHVHLSADAETAIQVGGRRKRGFTVLEIDAKQMVSDDHKFYISENGVWLSDHVPPKYLKELTT